MRKTKNQRLVGPIVLNLILSTITAISCSQSQDGDGLIGKWQAPKVELSITKEGDLYRVEISNPGGLLGGTYTGKYENSVLKIGAIICGDINYSKDTDKIFFCGSEYSRIPR